MWLKPVPRFEQLLTFYTVMIAVINSFSTSFIHVCELLFNLQVFCQTGPLLRLDSFTAPTCQSCEGVGVVEVSYPKTPRANLPAFFLHSPAERQAGKGIYVLSFWCDSSRKLKPGLLIAKQTLWLINSHSFFVFYTPLSIQLIRFTP